VKLEQILLDLFAYHNKNFYNGLGSMLLKSNEQKIAS
jgi:hypothetical protein